MTLQEFLDALDWRGAELARWPEEERRAAEALLATSEAAWRQHRALSYAERWLAETREGAGAPGLAAAVVRTPQAGRGAGLGRRLALGAAAAASLAVGIWAGAAAGPPHEPFDMMGAALGSGGDVG